MALSHGKVVTALTHVCKSFQLQILRQMPAYCQSSSLYTEDILLKFHCLILLLITEGRKGGVIFSLWACLVPRQV